MSDTQNKRLSTSSFRFLSLILLIGTVLFLTGCKSSRLASSSKPEEPRYLSSKVQLTIPHKEATMTINGTMKLQGGERMQLSFLMPILRSELVRLEVTPNDVLLIDRMGKRYVRANRKELKNYLPKKADFATLEKVLFAAAQPGGKTVITGKDLGIRSFDKAKIELMDFSTKEFALTPTEVSAKYKEVTWVELLEILSKL